MTVDQIIKAFGNVKMAAHMLGVHRNTLRNWRKSGVPWPQQMAANYIDARLKPSRKHCPEKGK